MPNNDTTPHELSTGKMPTDRPSPYGKQTVSHLGRRREWSDETSTGTVTFDNGVAVALR
jgi:hypothetical protein